jgi:MFS family permease
MTGRDPKSIIADDTMRAGQWLAVLVTVGLNALDGFDVLSISFASPGIAKDWGIDRATLGWVLSMELFGMAFGSVLLGGVADKIGRRPTILGCLVAMAIGMFGAGHAHGVADLLAWRLLTGLGIGGTLASINATAAELTNRRWRNFALALMVIGYPLGGVVGGLFVQRLLASASWHSVFIAGGWATAAFSFSSERRMRTLSGDASAAWLSARSDGCNPVVTLAVSRPESRSTIETAPLAATPRLSTTTAVPAEVAVRSPPMGKRPPQSDTYAVLPFGESTTSHGAIPTLICLATVPLGRSTTARVLLMDRQT